MSDGANKYLANTAFIFAVIFTIVFLLSTVIVYFATASNLAVLIGLLGGIGVAFTGTAAVITFDLLGRYRVYRRYGKFDLRVNIRRSFNTYVCIQVLYNFIFEALTKDRKFLDIKTSKGLISCKTENNTRQGKQISIRFKTKSDTDNLLTISCQSLEPKIKFDFGSSLEITEEIIRQVNTKFIGRIKGI